MQEKEDVVASLVLLTVSNCLDTAFAISDCEKHGVNVHMTTCEAL